MFYETLSVLLYYLFNGSICSYSYMRILAKAKHDLCGEAHFDLST